MIRESAHFPLLVDWYIRRGREMMLATRDRVRAWVASHPSTSRAVGRRATRERWCKNKATRLAEKERKRQERLNWVPPTPEEIAACRRESRKRQKQKVQVKLRHLLATRIRVSLRRAGASKSRKTCELLGCSVAEAKVHLERLFKPGMTWENFGFYGWHIDHIRPCSSFDLRDPEQQRACFHFSNLQPLWARENLTKHAKWTPLANWHPGVT